MSVLVVTGTGTEIGKTVVTAAVAALASDRGRSVAVVKPAQTGLPPGAPGDVDLVAALSGVRDVHEGARYPDPLAPATAARRAGLPAVDLGDVRAHLDKLAAHRDLVLVEGAGGLLVRFDEHGSTVADLAQQLRAPVLVVVSAGLGTLNTTALTLEALAHRGLELAGVVVGSWPADPDLACRGNLADLASLAGRPVAGAIPAGAGLLAPADFLATARRSLEPSLGGTFRAQDFQNSHPM
ncbi:dethiobiotin synthase [Frankia sp. AgPm24]|uniref:dethiobiotin synthase n=1 Tax=Frankia sp. AgPm24 TaxID=631128 RepID=UPI00200E0449|nr:dethiobiotin synthase [Frankia sp. AgPm24]MCK9924083.1 dethiobiotin synthase [Frankia sp. AgPm24]